MCSLSFSELSKSNGLSDGMHDRPPTMLSSKQTIKWIVRILLQTLHLNTISSVNKPSSHCVGGCGTDSESFRACFILLYMLRMVRVWFASKRYIFCPSSLFYLKKQIWNITGFALTALAGLDVMTVLSHQVRLGWRQCCYCRWCDISTRANDSPNAHADHYYASCEGHSPTRRPPRSWQQFRNTGISFAYTVEYIIMHTLMMHKSNTA